MESNMDGRSSPSLQKLDINFLLNDKDYNYVPMQEQSTSTTFSAFSPWSSSTVQPIPFSNDANFNHQTLNNTTQPTQTASFSSLPPYFHHKILPAPHQLASNNFSSSMLFQDLLLPNQRVNRCYSDPSYYAFPENSTEPYQKRSRTESNPEFISRHYLHNNSTGSPSMPPTSSPDLESLAAYSLTSSPTHLPLKENRELKSRQQVTEEQWLKQFEELKKFQAKYGHTNVTRTKPRWRTLGNWVTEQRRKQKQGKLLKKRVDMLSEIGFEWDRSYYFKPV